MLSFSHRSETTV